MYKKSSIIFKNITRYYNTKFYDEICKVPNDFLVKKKCYSRICKCIDNKVDFDTYIECYNKKDNKIEELKNNIIEHFKWHLLNLEEEKYKNEKK